MGTKSTAQADNRAAMIAEAAYFAAERRSFEPGYELSDWLAAEVEVETMLMSAQKVHKRKAAQSVTKKKAKKKAKKAAAKRK